MKRSAREKTQARQGSGSTGSSGPDKNTNSGNSNGRHTSLSKCISTRQMVFMALGGSIGAGLLLASGRGLVAGGPGGLLLAFTVVGFGVWVTMCALGELSSTYPVQGSFYDYSVQLISPSWGFSMGWNYVINFVLVVPFEITVMTLVTQYWWHDAVASVGLVPIFIAALAGIAYFGARWYAEAEHAFGIVKVLVLVLFIAAALAIDTGGVPADPRQGTFGRYWQDGAAFLNGYKGFLTVFVAAGLAYGGTEMLGLAVAEFKDARKMMPLASKIVAGRIVICYLLPLLMLGLVVAPDDLLTFQEDKSGVLSSPFVVAMHLAHLPVLAHIINGAILVSVFSMANASIFASSRALHAICAKKMGPSLFAQTTAKGSPRNALCIVFLFTLLAFIVAAPNGRHIFDWLMALASASNYFTWLSICLCHIRLRLAIKRQKLEAGNLVVWKSPLGMWGSVAGAVIMVLGLIAMVWSSVQTPVPVEDPASEVAQRLMGFAVVLTAWLGKLLHERYTTGKLVWMIPLDDIDLVRNMDHDRDVHVLDAAADEEVASKFGGLASTEAAPTLAFVAPEPIAEAQEGETGRVI